MKNRMPGKFFSLVVLLLTLVSKIVSLSSLSTIRPIDAIGLLSSIITITGVGKDALDLNEQNSMAALQSGINIVSKKLSDLQSSFYKKSIFLEKVSLSSDLGISLNRIKRLIKRVQNLYNEILQISRHTEDYNDVILDDLMDKMISYDEDYPTAILEELYNEFFSDSKFISNDISEMLLKYFKLNERELCDMQLSAQHQLFSLYNQVVLTEIQGFASMVFSFLWKRNHEEKQIERVKYVKQIINKHQYEVQRISRYAKLFHDMMKRAPNFIRRCDPPRQKYGETYIDINDLGYAFITNQLDFQPPRSSNCWKSCGDIETYEQTCEESGDCNYAYRNSCPGRVFDCQGDTSYAICRRGQISGKTNKLYDWFLDKQTKEYYGDTNQQCRMQDIQHAQKYATWLLILCYYCVCKCEDNYPYRNTQKIRAISFLWSSVDWENNMVATGVRLAARDRMMHIQLRQGKLLPNGKIDNKTESWVPLPKFSFKDNFPHKLVYPNGTKRILIQGDDYGLIKLKDTKICLNKLVVKGHVLTGIKFMRFVIDENEACIKLLTKYAKFDYKNGNLVMKKIRHMPPIYNADYKPKLPTKLILERPDDPLKLTTNIQDSGDNQFIEMGITDMKKDAGQTTIPFFDLLKVVTQPSIPISGIEIFHKGDIHARESGGYISLKIYPINLNMYMKSFYVNDQISNVFYSAKVL